MPFLGKTPTVGNFILLDSITVSNTATFALTKDSLDYYPGSAQNMIVSVNGVTQAPLTAYTITDSNIIFASALDSDVDVIDYILVLGDTLNIGRPSDSTVGATQIQDYAVTSVKMSNTGVGAATYGTSTSIPQITIDAAGRITSATGIDRSNQFENLTVTGNLTVSGNTVTVDAHTLDVEDPLIHLASNNTTTDVVDIGFIGHYSNDGSTQLHTGFFRDASDEKYYLFNGLEGDYDTATTIDRTANNFTLAHLNVGGLNANGIFTIGDRGTATEELTIFHEDNVSYLISDSSAGGGAKGEFSFRTNDGGTAAERVRIDGDGNVGIGTPAPDKKLVVTGVGAEIVINDTDTTDTPRLRFRESGSTSGSISTDAGEMRFDTSTTERMRINSAGNVLLGKNSNLNAHSRLEVATTETTTAVSSGAGAAISIQNLSTTDNTYSTIYFTNGGAGVDSAIYGIHEVGNGTGAGRAGSMVFATAALGSGVLEKMRISSTGDISVGSASNHSGARIVINDTPPTAFGSPMLQVGQETFTASGYYSIGLGYTAGSYTEPPAEIAAVSTSSSGGTTADIVFGTRSVTTNTAVTERMRIDSSGKVGIGASSGLSALLTVNGSTSTDSLVLGARDPDDGFNHLSETGSGVMFILGHNALKHPTTNNAVKNTTTGWHSHFVRMYYDHGIAFHTSASTIGTDNTTVWDNASPGSATSIERMRIRPDGIVQGLWSDNGTQNSSGKFMKLTQAQYNAITPDSNTIYFIT